MVMRMDGPQGPIVSPSDPYATGPKIDSSVESVAVALAGVSAAGATPQTADLPQVYMGPEDVPGRHDDLMDIESAAGILYEWFETPKYDWWGDLLVKKGWIPEDKGRDFDVLSDMWNYAAEKSAAFLQAGRRITPWGVMTLLAPQPGEGEDGEGGSGGGGPRTVTSTSVDLT